VEVRIRRSTEATARHLTTTTLDKLHRVIPILEEWGLEGDDGSLPLSGQISVGPEGSAAYFEVVIDDNEAST
jgi:hypothetical protein